MKYTVYMMTPYCLWEDVEAKDDAEAIKKCNDSAPEQFDNNELCSFLAILDGEG